MLVHVPLLCAVSSKIGKGMLPASMVFLHSCFLCWGALTSNPDISCNKYANDNDVSRIVIGIIISALMLSWTRSVCVNMPLWPLWPLCLLWLLWLLWLLSFVTIRRLSSHFRWKA